MNKIEIKTQASQLINYIESLEAYCKVARASALEVYEQADKNTGLVKLTVSANELVRAATLCEKSAARFDYAVSLALRA